MKANQKVISFVLTLILMTNLGCSFTLGPKAVRPGAKDGAAPGGGESTAVAGATAPAGTEKKNTPAAGADAEDGEAILVQGEFQRPSLNLPALGKIAFSADAAAAVTLEYDPASGEDQTLSLTDSAGLTWTLRLPPLALDRAETIKMTPLSGLQSDEVAGRLLGGVLLEPDGLQFHNPPALIVSGPGTEGKLLLLTGGQDGANMVLTAPGDEAASMLVFHFSSVVADSADDQTIQQLASQVEKNALEVSKQVRQWLKNNPKISVPEPPSIPIQCVSHANGENANAESEMSEKMSQFTQDFYAPEGEMLSRLTAVRQAQQLLGLESDPDYYLENRLMSRLIKKVRLLFKQYDQNKDKLKAVAQIALDVSGKAALIRFGSDTEMLFATEVRDWTERALDELLNELVEDHDYRNMTSAIELARWIAALGKGVNMEQLWKKLVGAMTFEFQGTFNIEVYGNQFYTLQATFPVTYDANNFYNGKLKGSGSVELASYRNTDEPDLVILSETGTDVHLTVTRFDPCEGLAQVSVDRFNFADETYKISKDQSQTIPATQSFWNGLFKEFKSSGDDFFGAPAGSYVFPTALNNLNANAIEDTIDGSAPASGGKLKGTFEIKLIHKPERVK